MRRSALEAIRCKRCGEESPALDKPPFQGDRGDRIRAQICAGCWKKWLKHQTLLINHYGLDPRDPKAREFLYSQVDDALLGDGEAESVDPSKQGGIKW
ncbi:MAG: oxidative damage protection protein [Gemmatimonadetes bacterium]|nr:oxidative damage protection protein [Gemmatimonadota bacterium]